MMVNFYIPMQIMELMDNYGIFNLPRIKRIDFILKMETTNI
jgi:hypothetical protein